MSFQPVIPSGGNLGWNFLNTTRTAQQAAFDSSPRVDTLTTYFAENISKVSSAEDLVADRRLLTVALGAFGLSDDIDNTFFVRKVLEEGTLAEGAFANRLSDTRYFALAEAFSFDLSPPKTALSDFAPKITERFQRREFEVAVGEQDDDLRLALSVPRELADLSERNLSEDAAWFTVMGNPPLRRVFEMALGLPDELAAIDVDRQLEEFREKATTKFGVTHPSEFAEPEIQDKLISNFLFRSELEAFQSATSSGSVALTLLQSQTPLF